MQLELLLDGTREIPAEKYERVAPEALGMQETPGFVRCGCQGYAAIKGVKDQGWVSMR